jgi:transcription initiation factor TFIID TATA-box-binding protein
MPPPDVIMQNVVCTFNLGVGAISLRDLANKTPFVEYNPKKFAAATARIVYPRTTALCFASGNMVCTGAKNEDLARLAARKYVHVLQQCGFKVYFHDFKIQNLVASTDVGGLLKLDEMATAYGTCAGYEPDMFPGLVLRLTDPKVVYLCFRSGKVVITGARNRQMILDSFARVHAEIMVPFIDHTSQSANSAVYRRECAARQAAENASGLT